MPSPKPIYIPPPAPVVHREEEEVKTIIKIPTKIEDSVNVSFETMSLIAKIFR